MSEQGYRCGDGGDDDEERGRKPIAEASERLRSLVT